MKRQILTLTLALAAMAAQAQLAPAQPQTPGSTSTSESSDNKGFKAESGDKTLELNFTPFSGSPLSLNYLRFRMFMSDDMAIRAGFNFGLQTTKSENDQSANSGPKSTTSTRILDLALMPGIEKHFAGTDRLSPYIGGELGIMLRSSAGETSSSMGTNTATDEISGATNFDPTTGDISDRGYFGFGLNGVIGCDFYFSRKIYMGLEASYGINFKSNSQVEVTSTQTGSPTVVTKGPTGSSFSLMPAANAAIRIGFAF